MCFHLSARTSVSNLQRLHFLSFARQLRFRMKYPLGNTNSKQTAPASVIPRPCQRYFVAAVEKGAKIDATQRDFNLNSSDGCIEE